jgi:dienelactone hydrolase
MRSTILIVVSLLSYTSLAAMVTKKIPYTVEKTNFEGVLVFDDSKTLKPGIILVPNWLGINEANLKQAQLVASRGYVVFVADMYGTKERPKNQEQAGKLAGGLKANRPQMRARMNAALQTFLAQKGLPLDDKNLAAIGFCFGGTAALELARSGAKIGAAVSFHGGLGSPTPDDAKNISAKFLALHGADDPYVPAEEVAQFQAEMKAAKVDWQLVSFGNAVHSFTDVDAATPGQSQYNATVATRAYQAMDMFLSEAFTSMK